jgi:glycosyltransferase involved in cell wall biosynthesis
MKICIINNLYPPYARGGAEQVVTKTVQGLAKAGHDVVVITTAPRVSVGVTMELERVKVYRFTPWNLYFYTQGHRHAVLTRLLWHLIDMCHIGAARYIGQVLREERPHIVHTHNLMGVGFLTPMVVKRYGIPLLHTLHDVQLVEPSGIIKKDRDGSWRYTGFPSKLYAYIMRHLLGSPDTVISPSKFLLEFYKRWGFFEGAETVILQNPVREVVESVVVPSDDVRLLYLGQIEDHKGVEFLVKSTKEFLSCHPEVLLTIAGDGSRMEALRELVGDSPNIHVKGRVSHDELVNIFGETDMTVVPSLCYENSPTVIFESFSYGVPVLAGRVEGVEELIVEGENGFLFDTGDGEALVRTLETHFHDIKSMRGNSTRFVRGLSESAYIELLTELYKKIA